MTGEPLSYRDLLRVPDLPPLLTATILSRLGGSMFSLAIVLFALTRFASPALAGWLTFAAVAPGLAISPFAGTLLDRFGPIWGIGVDMAASAVLVLGIVVADRSGAASPVVLLVLVTVFSLTSPLSAAGVRTLLPRLVPAHALDRVNALDTAIFAIADVCGPALAGMLIGLAGPYAALTAVGVAYGAAAACVIMVRSGPYSPVSRGSLLRQTLEGIEAVVRQPTLRGLALSYGLYQVAWGILIIAVPVALAGVFSTGTRDLVTGLLWGAVGVAGGAGALLAGHFRIAGRERQVMVVGMIVTALAAWSFGSGGLVIGLLLAGLVAGPIDVGVLTLRQRRTDPARLGRVMSVSISLNIAGFPVGSALAGALVTHSLVATFGAAGVAAALGALAVRMIPGDG